MAELRTSATLSSVWMTRKRCDMGVKLERLVKRYYEALEEGKVLGRKCPVCGNVEWPPVYACNACGST
ncbi:MAG: hypothetical protein IIZ52_01220, partial [Erysipelotrichaceae bacterium]|nr:hypothetical protein [Erysipelotrichaceae bacterium]